MRSRRSGFRTTTKHRSLQTLYKNSIVITPNGANSAPHFKVAGDLSSFLMPSGPVVGGEVVAEVRYRQSPGWESP
jgi:hypothetical protein